MDETLIPRNILLFFPRGKEKLLLKDDDTSSRRLLLVSEQTNKYNPDDGRFT
jgi:hypothetical protein